MFPVEVAPEALAQLKSLKLRKGGQDTCIRFGVKGGGCSGLEYVLKLEDNRLPIDLVAQTDGLTLLCDEKSAKYLQGAKLVWTGNLIGGGFSFENPNADRSCGCGTSFSLKKKD
ncbi:MAG: iron-sulfur cluster assembly accessory protein [Armatimonadetes bacterium]|nr:iron-sulfur cluster assembly accessory protein [Armatimonadota bacterium]